MREATQMERGIIERKSRGGVEHGSAKSRAGVDLVCHGLPGVAQIHLCMCTLDAYYTLTHTHIPRNTHTHTHTHTRIPGRGKGAATECSTDSPDA